MISQTPHNPKAKFLNWAKDMNEKMLNITTHQKIQTKPLRYHDCTLLETDSIPKQEVTIIAIQEINAFKGMKKRELLYSGG